MKRSIIIMRYKLFLGIVSQRKIQPSTINCRENLQKKKKDFRWKQTEAAAIFHLVIN